MLVTFPGGMLPFYLFIFLEKSDGPLFTALTLFPLTAPVTSMIRVASHTISGWELGLSLVLLTGSIVLAMWATAKIFRAFLLMYGKRPGVGEIAKAIRQA
jgi:ABC-2 type transport system permease protein